MELLDFNFIDDWEDHMMDTIKQEVAEQLFKDWQELEANLKEEEFGENFSFGDAKMCTMNLLNNAIRKLGYAIYTDENLNDCLRKVE